MQLIPYERFTIKSTLSPERALQKLTNVVGPKPEFMQMRTDSKPYEGTITETQFSIRRTINYRNSFLPMIQGEIQPEMTGCSIKFTLSLHIIVLIFMDIWLGSIGIYFISLVGSFLSALMQDNSTFPSWQGIPFAGGMFILGYALMTIAFNFEAGKSKDFFLKLFQGHLSNDTV